VNNIVCIAEFEYLQITLLNREVFGNLCNAGKSKVFGSIWRNWLL